MKTITVYGASDDLLEIEGPFDWCDEYGNYPTGDFKGPSLNIGKTIEFKSDDATQVIRFTSIYDGWWSFLPLVDSDVETDGSEGHPWPAWPFTMTNGFPDEISVIVTIELPDDVRFRLLDENLKPIKRES